MKERNITMRLARLSDAGLIAIMSRDLIESGLGWSWNPSRVARSIRDPNCVTVMACDRGRVAAFAIMHFGDERSHLSLLAVRPSHQRLGIGRRLIEWLVEAAYVAGIATIHLELRASNGAARSFYRALGFAETAYVPGYYRGREMALRMVRTLRSSDIQPYDWTPAAGR